MSTNHIASLLKEQVLNLIIDSCAPVVTHKEQKYAQVSPLCKFLGINRGGLRRKFNYHQGLIIQQYNRRFIRVDYIPWWLVNLHGNLSLSEDARARLKTILAKMGILVPEL